MFIGFSGRAFCGFALVELPDDGVVELAGEVGADVDLVEARRAPDEVVEGVELVVGEPLFGVDEGGAEDALLVRSDWDGGLVELLDGGLDGPEGVLHDGGDDVVVLGGRDGLVLDHFAQHLKPVPVVQERNRDALLVVAPQHCRREAVVDHNLVAVGADLESARAVLAALVGQVLVQPRYYEAHVVAGELLAQALQAEVQLLLARP